MVCRVHIRNVGHGHYIVLGTNVGHDIKHILLIQAHSLKSSAVMFKISLNNKKH